MVLACRDLPFSFRNEILFPDNWRGILILADEGDDARLLRLVDRPGCIPQPFLLGWDPLLRISSLLSIDGRFTRIHPLAANPGLSDWFRGGGVALRNPGGRTD